MEPAFENVSDDLKDGKNNTFPLEWKIKKLPGQKNESRAAVRALPHVEPETLWWREAVIYQLYVPSFKDTNDDGYGDLPGVLENVDYLARTGFDIVWLSPIFDSPMYDLGYDISDYYKINPLYGTMQDFEELVRAIHARGMKVILDIALNHTSTKHVWMNESIRAHLGEDNGKKDFYIWVDPKYDAHGHRVPPSNWSSVFQGSMWKYVPEINKYFLHIFGDEQADLNWDNPATRQKLFEVLRFWLDKGIDGFRLDAINCISKVHDGPDSWPDAEITNPTQSVQKANEMFANGPQVHKYLREMYEEVFKHYPHAMTLGEMSCGITPELGIEFISRDPDKRQLDLIIHFEHVELDCWDGDKWLLREWKVPELKKIVTAWQTKMVEAGGWDTVWLENHDQPRATTRYVGREKAHHNLGAKLLAIWLFTLQGTVMVYQGQELGMQNREDFTEEMLRDIETVIYWNTIKGRESEDGYHDKVATVKKAMIAKAREHARIPIPWKADPHTCGGFTNGNGVKPWLPTDKNMAESCVEEQLRDSVSIWAFYRKMIELRKHHKTLIYGTYEIIEPEHPHLFIYTRTLEGDKYLIALNFSSHEVTWRLRQELGTPDEWWLLTTNYDNAEEIYEREKTCRHLRFRGHEGKIWRRAGLDDEGDVEGEENLPDGEGDVFSDS